MNHKRLPRRGGSIAYTDQGEGPALLLLHGLGDTTRTWRALTPRLLDVGYRVLELHLRGCGESDATFQDYKIAAIAGDAIAALEDAGVERVTVVGCSLGGAVAAWMAVERPELVDRLVFLNAFVRDMPADRVFRPIAGVLFAPMWGAFLWKMYWKTLFPTKPAGLEADAQWLRVHLREPGRLAALRAQLRAPKASVEGRLGEVGAPTLILMGGKDPDYSDPEEEGRTQAKLLGGPATLKVLEGVGHYPQLEATDAVFDALRTFVK